MNVVLVVVKKIFPCIFKKYLRAGRWRTLLSVDVMVEKVVHALEQYELLADTYILLTSDHGYHLGQFAMPLDKRLPYEFDIRVSMMEASLLCCHISKVDMLSLVQIPFWLRGPNITAGQVIKNPVLTIDIAPTLLELAGVATSTEQQDMDGLSICPLVVSNGTNTTATNTSNQVDLDSHTMSISFTLAYLSSEKQLICGRPQGGYF